MGSWDVVLLPLPTLHAKLSLFTDPYLNPGVFLPLPFVGAESVENPEA
jgi:hypothetical protein